ncbi:unnamed protein product [Haemonchus placei]|uniref:5'-3' exoribonuclease 1 n=1 Tax=Haemonchus placei TaxID=6290 RepID=A0A158QM76_HAEPC|nr:unnamed protein product [Haemonchus placei]
MGVPKFYRWISERYPCLSEVISDTEIPEFDNLYLDMNGIIHNCSHPNDDDVNFRISQEQIFCDIFAYIDKLFNIIRPQKVFFLAVDGVAPRAKMNQQRARRFMSARTAAEQEQAHVRKGGKLPTEKRFDSNCITPGTVFMAELHQALSSWLNVKIDKDPLWHNIRVYLSGHDCPGEGEHKIMEFIRHERIADGYDPNTRHCMYGLDADLLMLGICSHEPHFSLLREEVKFSRPPSKKSGAGSAQRANPSQTNFHLLHLSLLREYLSWEFDPLKASLPFPYDVDRIVDDWVLMGFLVGNDFIPHLPHVHIHDDALPLLYQTYIQILPTLDGYINESGILHLKRFEVFLKAFAANDRKHFLQIMEDESYLRSKRCQEPHGQNTEESSLSSTDSNDERDETTEDSLLDEAAFVSSDEEEDTAEAANRIPDGGLPSASYLLTHLNSGWFNCWTKTVSNSFRRHKRSYYREKLQYENITKTELRQQAEGYVRAIQWNLHYYYRGCVSWNWFYPHHYSPYISDVVDFSDMDMSFELGQPFKPFEQLLAVLPTASAECLPQPLRDLMCNKESPISDFYPTDFRTDLNGKKNDWEAVVLIPFIDEKRLLSAMESKIPLLTQEEKLRNTPGNILLYCSLELLPPSLLLRPVLLPVDSFYLEPQKVVWGLLPNVKLDVYFPGFPTMKHLPHSAELKQVKDIIFLLKKEEFEKVREVFDGRLLSRITGTVFLLHERSSESKDLPKIPERINIGLSLKFSKRNQEVWLIGDLKSKGTTVPFGSQGTVVGLSSGKVDVLFDLEFNGKEVILGACVPKTSLINITYGKTRKGQKLKRQRENGSLRAKIGKRLVAGKESKENTPSGIQKVRNSLLPDGYSLTCHVSEQLVRKSSISTCRTKRAFNS